MEKPLPLYSFEALYKKEKEAEALEEQVEHLNKSLESTHSQMSSMQESLQVRSFIALHVNEIPIRILC